MDRVDLSMPGVLSGLHGELVRGRDASILVKVEERTDESLGMIRVDTRSGSCILEQMDWPMDWKLEGIGRVVVREGFLEFLPR